MQSTSDRKEPDRVALTCQTASLAVSTALSGRVFYPGSPCGLGRFLRSARLRRRRLRGHLRCDQPGLWELDL